MWELFIYVISPLGIKRIREPIFFIWYELSFPRRFDARLEIFADLGNVTQGRIPQLLRCDLKNMEGLECQCTVIADVCVYFADRM